MAQTNIYTYGGTVQAGNGIYIPRQADHELLELCLNGAFAYVLTARQMGKSSLMERTKAELTRQGIVSVSVDLSGIGVHVSAEQWYFGILQTIQDELKTDIDLQTWWHEQEYLSVAQRMLMFFDNVLLRQSSERIVVFFDEIDSTLSLPAFTDDFFAALRYVYNARATKAAFQRLSFVLIGVAMPSELISDPSRTPFNVGQRVVLTDFTEEEARPLVNGLKLPIQHQEKTLQEVLQWTGGHPYLTQRVFYELSTFETQSKSNLSLVEQAVRRAFFDHDMNDQDTHLKWLRMWLTKRESILVDLGAVLKIYEQILLGGAPVYDQEDSVAHAHLKLSGIVRREGDELVVRNRIYAEIFDRKWLYKELAIINREREQAIKSSSPLQSVEHPASASPVPTLTSVQAQTPSQPVDIPPLEPIQKSAATDSKRPVRPEPAATVRPASSPSVSAPDRFSEPQVRDNYRRRLPAWVQQLPYLRFPQAPDPGFQLISRSALHDLLRDAGPEVLRRLDEDMQFLDFELMRLFRARDFEAKQQQNRYRLYRVGFLMLAALAALIGAVQSAAFYRNPDIVPWLSFSIVVILLLTTYLATISGRESPLPLWFANRRRAEQLRREYFRYLMNMPPYDELEGYARQMLLSKRAADINRGIYPQEGG